MNDEQKQTNRFLFVIVDNMNEPDRAKVFNSFSE